MKNTLRFTSKALILTMVLLVLLPVLGLLSAPGALAASPVSVSGGMSSTYAFNPGDTETFTIRLESLASATSVTVALGNTTTDFSLSTTNANVRDLTFNLSSGNLTETFTVKYNGSGGTSNTLTIRDTTNNELVDSCTLNGTDNSGSWVNIDDIVFTAGAVGDTTVQSKSPSMRTAAGTGSMTVEFSIENANATGVFSLSSTSALTSYRTTISETASTPITIYANPQSVAKDYTADLVVKKVNTTTGTSTVVQTVKLQYVVSNRLSLVQTSNMASVIEGYSSVPTLSYSINNAGSSTTGTLSMALSDTTRFTFVGSAVPSSQNLAAGINYTSGRISPVLGLSAGTYPCTVTLYENNSIAGTFSFNFTVTTSSSGGSTSTTMSARTITHSTGVKVTATATASATLSVTANSLHSAGSCAACDTIREYMAKNAVLKCYNISLPSGSYTGNVTVSIPVGSTYNGRMVTMLHCNNGTLEQRNVIVAGGHAAAEFSSLSPFAVLDGQYEVVTGGSSSGGSNTDTNSVDPPKTGDEDIYFSWGALLITVALLLAVVFGMVLIQKYQKKKQEI